jgi:hypothetical protein
MFETGHIAVRHAQGVPMLDHLKAGKGAGVEGNGGFEI